MKRWEDQGQLGLLEFKIRSSNAANTLSLSHLCFLWHGTFFFSRVYTSWEMWQPKVSVLYTSQAFYQKRMYALLNFIFDHSRALWLACLLQTPSLDKFGTALVRIPWCMLCHIGALRLCVISRGNRKSLWSRQPPWLVSSTLTCGLSWIATSLQMHCLLSQTI